MASTLSKLHASNARLQGSSARSRMSSTGTKPVPGLHLSRNRLGSDTSGISSHSHSTARATGPSYGSSSLNQSQRSDFARSRGSGMNARMAMNRDLSNELAGKLIDLALVTNDDARALCEPHRQKPHKKRRTSTAREHNPNVDSELSSRPVTEKTTACPASYIETLSGKHMFKSNKELEKMGQALIDMLEITGRETDVNYSCQPVFDLVKKSMGLPTLEEFEDSPHDSGQLSEVDEADEQSEDSENSSEDDY